MIPGGIKGRNGRSTARVSDAVAMRPHHLLPLFLLVACVTERGPLTNRMAQMSTTYLTRAARQPGSWQPWGREALALAARLDRPGLRDVGAPGCRRGPRTCSA